MKCKPEPSKKQLHLNAGARRAILRLLAGQAPNGTRPDSCGDYAELVRQVYDAYELGGSDPARDVIELAAVSDDTLLRLMMEAEQLAEAESLRDDLPTLPAAAFEKLPAIISECCENLDRWFERDAFLTGALGTISSLLPKVRFRYGKKLYSAHLFFFVLAEAGRGKGVLTHSLALADLVDEYLVSCSDRAKSEWDEAVRAYDTAKRSKRLALTDPDPPGPKPPELLLRAAEDTNLPVLYQNLAANREGILIGATEADILSQANKRGDFGGFSALFRQAFEHERAQKATKTEGTVRVHEPRIALVLSGTRDQFAPLVESVENGLFSRFAVYRFSAPLEYRSQRPRPEDVAFVKAIEKAKERLLALYKILATREEPLYVDMPAARWEKIDQAFQQLFNSTLRDAGAPGELAASIFRGVVIAFRIATILTVLRRFEEGIPLERVASLEVGQQDAEAATALAFVYVEQAMRQALDMLQSRDADNVLSAIAESAGSGRLTGQQQSLLQMLPDEFGRKEAVEVGRTLGAGTRSVDRWIRAWSEGPDALLVRQRHGGYVKSGNIVNSCDSEPISQNSAEIPRGISGNIATYEIEQKPSNRADLGEYDGFADFATGGAPSLDADNKEGEKCPF
ncbi:MAG: DUF3987 domain-containing protein [Rhodothermales bacterium]